jgi:hypothetical protein
VHLGDDDLRHGLHEVHQLGAGEQHPAYGVEVGPGDVGEVVAGAEHRAVARPARSRSRRRGHLVERAVQLAQVVGRQRVAPRRGGPS